MNRDVSTPDLVRAGPRVTWPSFGPRPVFDAADDAAAAAAATAAAAAAAAAATAAADKAAADAAAKVIADKAAADAAAAALAADVAAGKITAREAELTAANAARAAELKVASDALAAAQARLAEFDGLSATEAKAAATAKKAAEVAALEAAGDYKRLRTMMAEAHAAELAAEKAAHKTKDTALEAAQRTINDLTIGTSFTGSPFVTTELALPPAKARQIYGAHFGVEDGKVVGYDKPAGATARTKLVDAAGQPLPFDAAMKKLVEADPDRDSLLVSKLLPGAKSKTVDAKIKAEGIAPGTGLNRIEAALRAGQLPAVVAK